jgi:hypothetical protein
MRAAPWNAAFPGRLGDAGRAAHVPPFHPTPVSSPEFPQVRKKLLRRTLVSGDFLHFPLWHSLFSGHIPTLDEHHKLESRSPF